MSAEKSPRFGFFGKRKQEEMKKPTMFPAEVVGPASDLKDTYEDFKDQARFLNKTHNNEERSVWEKIRGKNKLDLTKEDIALDAAEDFQTFIEEYTKGDTSKEPEAVANWYFERDMDGGVQYKEGVLDCKNFVKVRDMLVEVSNDKVSAETINGWIRTLAVHNLERAAGGEYGWGDLRRFVEQRDAWVKAGVVTKKEANALPQVQRAVALQIENDAAMAIFKISNYVEARDHWVAEGLITEKEANELLGVQHNARYYIEDAAKKVASAGDSIGAFTSQRDGWVAAGVTTKEDANKLLGVRYAAQHNIRTKARSWDKGEQAIKDWVGAGVLDEKSARALVQQ